MSNLTSEVWKTIPGFSNYQASQYGRIRSLVKGDPVPLKLQANKSNYCTYMRTQLINDAGESKKVRVHLVVLETFLGPRPSSKHKGCHIDGNSTNNWLLNLKWATPEENEADKAVHGTRLFGVKIHCAKLNPEKVRRIRAAYDKGWNSAIINKLIRTLGVSRTAIVDAAKRKSWKEVV